jgi:hypothetical protein
VAYAFSPAAKLIAMRNATSCSRGNHIGISV